MVIPRPLSDYPAEEPGPFVIIQGQDFRAEWDMIYDEGDVIPSGKNVGDPYDLSDYTGVVQIRTTPTTTGSAIWEGTTEDGNLELGALGTIVMGIPNAESSAFSVAALPEVSSGSDDWRLLGQLHIEITDPDGVRTRPIEVDEVAIDPELVRP